MQYKSKEEKLWDIFEQRLIAGASNDENTLLNMKIVHSISRYIWIWRQEYKTNCTSYIISRKTYNKLIQTVKELENQIQSGRYTTEATQAVQDAYKWVECLLAHRIRLTKAEKPRVY
ncbi:MAG: hypothetical protein R3Y09_00080 [Clostridia bacterium]